MGNIASAGGDHPARGIELPGHAKAAMHHSGKVIAAETAIPLRRAECRVRAYRRAGDRGRRPTDKAAAIPTGLRAEAPQGWRCSRPRCRESSPSTSCIRTVVSRKSPPPKARMARVSKDRAHSSRKTTRAADKRGVAPNRLPRYHRCQRQIGSGRISRDCNRAGIENPRPAHPVRRTRSVSSTSSRGAGKGCSGASR